MKGMKMNESSDKKEVMSHLEDDIEYPASKDQIVMACNQMSDVPEKDKEWFTKKLPDRTYQSAQEVKMAIGM